MPIKNELFRTIKKHDLMQVILLANIMVPLFIKTEILLILFQIFVFCFFIRQNYGGNLYTLFSRLAIIPWSLELTIKTLDRCSGVFIVDFVQVYFAPCAEVSIVDFEHIFFCCYCHSRMFFYFFVFLRACIYIYSFIYLCLFIFPFLVDVNQNTSV